MAQTIKLKRSATSGAIPTTSSLALGEVAINTYDGRMYIKKDVGGTETIVQVGADANSVSYLEAGMIEYEYTATSNQTSFSGSDDNSATLSYVAESIMVFVNGVLQDDGVDYTASNGTSVVFGTGLAAADEVRIVAFTNVTTAANLQDPTKLDAISTVNNQAAYSLTLASSAYTPSSQNALIVSLNGITQEPGDSFTISGSTITFSPALVTGDVIDYIIDMGRAVTIGEYSGDLAVGGELEVTGDIIGDLRGSTLFKAQAGEALSKGSVVYISGISGNTTVVSKADANDSAKMPAFGIAAEAASVNNPVDVYTFGLLSGIDTSSYSEGDELFVSNTAGELISTPPTGEASKLQKIAKVARSHASAGSIFIMGAGRSNAVPNLDDGDIFIGNSSNQAVSAALDTSIVPENGNLYYTDARVDSRLASGNVGIGVSNPDAPLHVKVTEGSTGETDPIARFERLTTGDNHYLDITLDNSTNMVGFQSTGTSNGGFTFGGASSDLVTITSAGKVGIGTISPTSQLHLANGTSSPTVRLENTATSGGNYYMQSYVTGSTSRLRFGETGVGEHLCIESGGNVGIGTDSPAVELDVASAAPQLRLTDTDGGYCEVANVGGHLLLQADKGNTQASSYMRFDVDGSERMRINSSGNVGINQSNPAEKLDVSGNVKLTGQFFQSMPSDFWSQGTTFIEINGLGNLTHQGSFETCLTSNGYRDNNNQWKSYAINNFTGAAQIKLNPQGHISFHTDSNKADGSSSSLTERMRINSSGNVGIGTSLPASQLHLKSDDPLIRFEDDQGGAARVYECGSAQGQFTINNVTQSTQPFAINDSGLVRIGPSSAAPAPSAMLHIHKNVNAGVVAFGDEASQVISSNTNAAGAQGYIGSMFFGAQDISSATQYAWKAAGIAGYMAGDLGTGGATADLLFYTASASQTPTERMRITSGGNVGIGITPTDKLHLAGTAPQIVKLECTDTSLVSDQVVGALQWRTNDPSGSGVGDCAQIAVRSASTVGGSFIMQFNIASTTALNQEAMRLDRDGNLLIGGIISSPAAKLVVFSTGNGSLTYDTGHTGIHINNENATAGNGNFGGGISFSRFGSTADDQSAAIVPVQTTTDPDHMGLAFFIHHTNTRANPLKEAARIDEDGLKFNGDTAAANALDDYEEGTWTPTTPNGSWTVNEATYTKIGRLVYVRARVSAISAVSGDFGGLPFTVSGNYTAGSVGYQNSVSSEVFSLLVQAPTNYNFRIGSGQYGLAAGKQAMFSATYETT